LDRIAIAGAALGGFIRVGNLMNSEMIGIPSDLPWAFIFTRVDQTTRHPAQLYEAIVYLAISIALYLIWKSKKFYEHNGFICGLGIAVIFAQRFLIEFLKENQVSFEEDLTLNMGQTLSIPLILGGVGLMIRSLKSSLANSKPQLDSASMQKELAKTTGVSLMKAWQNSKVSPYLCLTWLSRSLVVRTPC
jgi:phosphatidylglycerol:prolipoprotein diacylglycerol transferase